MKYGTKGNIFFRDFLLSFGVSDNMGGRMRNEGSRPEWADHWSRRDLQFYRVL